jgi:hypothetical protein
MVRLINFKSVPINVAGFLLFLFPNPIIPAYGPGLYTLKGR